MNSIFLLLFLLLSTSSLAVGEFKCSLKGDLTSKDQTIVVREYEDFNSCIKGLYKLTRNSFYCEIATNKLLTLDSDTVVRKFKSESDCIGGLDKFTKGSFYCQREENKIISSDNQLVIRDLSSEIKCLEELAKNIAAKHFYCVKADNKLMSRDNSVEVRDLPSSDACIVGLSKFTRFDLYCEKKENKVYRLGNPFPVKKIALPDYKTRSVNFFTVLRTHIRSLLTMSRLRFVRSDQQQNAARD